MGYTENINSILKWGNAFQRQFGIPLDRSSLHSSYADAVAYAKGDGSDERRLGKEAYIGQIITVWGLNENNEEGVWVYSLVPSTNEEFLAELKPVGSVEIEDDSITVSKIANNAVTTDKIANGSVTTAKLNANAFDNEDYSAITDIENHKFASDKIASPDVVNKIVEAKLQVAIHDVLTTPI